MKIAVTRLIANFFPAPRAKKLPTIMQFVANFSSEHAIILYGRRAITQKCVFMQFFGRPFLAFSAFVSKCGNKAFSPTAFAWPNTQKAACHKGPEWAAFKGQQTPASNRKIGLRKRPSQKPLLNDYAKVSPSSVLIIELTCMLGRQNERLSLVFFQP